MRLDKYLTEMGIGSRSEVKQGIRKGFVKVNGMPAARPELKVTEEDEVTWKGTPVIFVEYEYIMLNKPAGVISATEDARERTVLDLIKNCSRKDLFPVGRLDKDTEGLLLLTNDGDLAHRLLSPKHHVSKIYYAKVDGVMTERDIRLFKEGLKVDDSLTALPANLTILKTDENSSEIQLEIYEGKFHQVKRMVHAVGKEVVYLKRLSMGSLLLDETLEPGAYRPLTSAEVEGLYAE
ncbi:pseudouridine synthase [Frisingicoccus sp.]|uniref:pseudouridine synthase n=1 Tax=Frisingicoccus sp. TaxID=1918627 RepID=UPI002EC781C5|nr:pseudouridine synthase [Frisingicoccus sp.]